MRILTIGLAISGFAVFSSFSEEHEQHNHHSHRTAGHPLIEQLGYGMISVEDHQIAGRLVTAVPINALYHQDGKAFVIAQDEENPNSYQRWEVKLGDTDGQHVEVTAGVFPGDRIVVQLNRLVSLKDEAEAEIRKQPAVAAAPPRTTLAPPAVAPPSVPGTPSGKLFGIQVGAFSKAGSAEKVASQLRSRYGRTDVLSNGQSLFRVRVGEFRSFRTASATSVILKQSGYPEAFVVEL